MGERSILIRRCYGSPDRMRPFRAYFTRSGFQVVDCPPLTTSGKNSADIVMTLDIADTIEHRTRFDEFVILSSDADFTPVALRLRAYDRITSILANQQTAAAFRSCCDVVINYGRLRAGGGRRLRARCVGRRPGAGGTGPCPWVDARRCRLRRHPRGHQDRDRRGVGRRARAGGHRLARHAHPTALAGGARVGLAGHGRVQELPSRGRGRKRAVVADATDS